MDAQAYSDHPQMKSAITLRGTAKDGKAGPPIGVVDIGAAEKAYLFRVAVPGVDKESGKLKCSIGVNGRVEVQGEITDRGVLSSSTNVYRMITQQLSPPGPFSVYFNLPGPVDTRFTLANFRQDGILEVMAFKKSQETEHLEFIAAYLQRKPEAVSILAPYKGEYAITQIVIVWV